MLTICLVERLIKLIKTSNMKISELIKELQEIQKEHGDVQVRVIIDGYNISIGYLDYAVRDHTLYLVE